MKERHDNDGLNKGLIIICGFSAAAMVGWCVFTIIKFL